METNLDIKERNSRQRLKKLIKSGKYNSRRFCLTCRKITSWRPTKEDYHSRCTTCGGVYSARPR